MAKKPEFFYQISPSLLQTLKQIAVEISNLNHKKFPEIVLLEMQAEANAQSSYSSTSIEGNPLPLTDVKKLLKQKPAQLRNTEKEVLNYNNALIWLNEKLESSNLDFNLALVLQLHQKVIAGLLPKAQTGKLRQEPVFVNDPKLRKTIYWPPDHKDVPKLLNELTDFISVNQKQMDPIILAGIFHKQFVVIHPFIDGNGRTVRLATKVLLARLGIDTFNLFSFENYYNQSVTRYFQNVGVRGDYYDIAKKLDFTSWLEYFAEGILDELLRVKKILEKEVQTGEPNQKLSVDQQRLLDFIIKNAFIKDKDYAKFTKRAKATRALDFKKLIALDLIERKGVGPSTYYVLKK